jgi:hypothetical protein
MRIGFVQNITVTAFNGTYNTKAKNLISSIQGKSYLDYVDGSTAPYYVDTGSGVFFDPSPTAKTKNLISGDTPANGPPLTYDQGGFPEAGDDVVDSMALKWDFVLYVTARTIDTQNAANDIYTSRAKGNWEFNGAGTVSQYTWSAGGAAGVTAPSGWSGVSDGSQPTHTSGAQFNTALRSDTWSTP